MSSSPYSVAVLFLAISRVLFALQVTPGSPCALRCLDSPTGDEFKASDSNTNTSDIACQDREFLTTDKGIKFKTCLECLETSSKVDGGESDLKWYIYSLRYSLGTCLFGQPQPPPNFTLDSACNIDKACRPLRTPLTADRLLPVSNGAFDYCTANDGLFMGPNLTPCILCLQVTEGQAYLSNFLAALEAGCRQNPQDGSILRLRGSVFATKPLTMGEPTADHEQGGRGGFTPSAIAGIVIGVVIISSAAVALCTIHLCRKRWRGTWDGSRYYKFHATPHVSYPPAGRVDRPQANDGDSSNNPPGEKASPYTVFDNYYERVGIDRSDQGGSSHNATGPEPSGSTIPTHQAYNPPTSSRTANQANLHPPVATPAPVHNEPRTNTPDSFAVQAYLNAAEDSARISPRQPPGPTAKSASQDGKFAKLCSLIPPSLRKLQAPHRDQNPPLPGEIATPGGVHRGHEMQVSHPVMQDDPAFHNGQIGATWSARRERPAPLRQPSCGDDKYIEVPLRSGKSDLYG
ncbi:hypothetical protein RJ55_02589 [Drechmeria coniospora]|nr:hypothetical protein RJ55_02589 [Drechmeria coniospora]